MGDRTVEKRVSSGPTILRIASTQADDIISSHCGPSFRRSVQRILYNLLRLRIQCRRSLVQQQDFRIPNQSSSDCYPLFLQAGLSRTHQPTLDISLDRLTAVIPSHQPPYRNHPVVT